jgi:hypothetical protein
MGYTQAQEFADSGVGLETALSWHLQYNHYPPVPVSMVPVCVAAIDAMADDEPDRAVDLPDGISYRGQTSAPAWAIADQHHLGPWCEELGGW